VQRDRDAAAQADGHEEIARPADLEIRHSEQHFSGALSTVAYTGVCHFTQSVVCHALGEIEGPPTFESGQVYFGFISDR
jgi:hypothetical protein